MSCNCNSDNSASTAKKAVWVVCGFVLMLVAACLWLAEYGRSEN